MSAFADLATEAAEAGTRIGLEFLPWSNIKTVHERTRSTGGGCAVRER